MNLRDLGDKLISAIFQSELWVTHIMCDPQLKVTPDPISHC